MSVVVHAQIIINNEHVHQSNCTTTKFMLARDKLG